jgi:hypothetical protein
MLQDHDRFIGPAFFAKVVTDCVFFTNTPQRIKQLQFLFRNGSAKPAHKRRSIETHI